MKKASKGGNNGGNNFVDALDRENGYAVLTKEGRLQILIKPTAKQLRKRGKRGWQLFGTVESQPGAGQTLIETVRRAITELETAGEASANHV